MCGRDRTVGDRRIEHAYVFDRLGDERLTQAYRILIPQRRRLLKPTSAGRECGAAGGTPGENRRDLRAGILGPAERGTHDRQPDQRPARVRHRP